MDRKNRISSMSSRVAFFFLAEGKSEDDVSFSTAFDLVRQKARDFKEKQEQEAADSLEKSLIKDLKVEGYSDVSVEISLGKYKGSRFVTSAKVRAKVKDRKAAKELAKYLQRYHPGYHLQDLDVETGMASYNFRSSGRRANGQDK